MTVREKVQNSLKNALTGAKKTFAPQINLSPIQFAESPKKSDEPPRRVSVKVFAPMMGRTKTLGGIIVQEESEPREIKPEEKPLLDPNNSNRRIPFFYVFKEKFNRK